MRVQPDATLNVDRQVSQLRASGVTPPPVNLPAMYRLKPVAEHLTVPRQVFGDWVGLAEPWVLNVLPRAARTQIIVRTGHELATYDEATDPLN